MTFSENCVWQPWRRGNGHGDIKGSVPSKGKTSEGPDVGLCLVCFKNKRADKTEWRGRLIGDENTRKSNKRARLYKTLQTEVRALGFTLSQVGNKCVTRLDFHYKIITLGSVEKRP